MPPLKNSRRELLAQGLAAGKTFTAAAVAAGYSKKSPSAHIMRDDVVRRRNELMEIAGHRAELNATRVLEEIRRIAFADLRKFFDEEGNLLSIGDLDEADAAALAGFEVIKKNAEAGDHKTDRVHKIKVCDKNKALEMLAKYFGLLQERIEHTGEVSFRWQTPAERGGGGSVIEIEETKMLEVE